MQSCLLNLQRKIELNMIWIQRITSSSIDNFNLSKVVATARPAACHRDKNTLVGGHKNGKIC
jgi:hypothetical protein